MRYFFPLLLLAAACVSTNATVLDLSVRPTAICPEGVKVYAAETDVKADFTKVALLNSSGDDDLTDESGMVKSQRKKAAQLGANGIILGEIKGASSGAKIASALIGTSQNRKGRAIAIYVASDTARVREVCTSRVRQ